MILSGQRSLAVQIVFNFIIIIIITALVVGLPAIWLIRAQSVNQAWAQVEQGSRSTQALLTSMQNEMNGLALLTAQRPSLPAFIASQQTGELQGYLGTLQEGTKLDLLLVCDNAQRSIAAVGRLAVVDLCRQTTRSGYYIAPDDSGSRLWSLAIEPVESMEEKVGFVIVGVALDNSFADELRNQTGLEHILLVNDEIVSSSLPDTRTRSTSQVFEGQEEPLVGRTSLILNDRPYYAAQLPLGSSTIVDEIALDVSNTAVTQQGLISIIVISILMAAAAGSILAVFLARLISKPLQQLTQAAKTLSTGDLDHPVQVNSQVQEVTMVAQALEKSRTDLQQLLNQLRQTNDWNDHLLRSISEGIVVLDENGRITFYSPGAARISGSPEEETLNRPVDEIFQLAVTGEQFSGSIPPPGHPYKVTLLRKDGHTITAAVSASRLELPSIGKAGVALVFRDITDVERMHHLLGQFLANITHEFRTPLSALAASTELLLDQFEDLSTGEIQELLNNLFLGILGLQTLIDNLLEGASLEAGRFRVYPRTADIDTIIIEAAKMLEPLLIKYSQHLRLQLSESLPQVQADPRRTTQVIVNLLSNAIKYSPDGAEILITAVEKDQFIQVAVADSGPGIPSWYRPDLFRRMIHPGLDSDKAQYGVGLGLSVVKAIVEAQGGEVGVEDRSGGGSIFWFTIPTGSA